MSLCQDGIRGWNHFVFKWIIFSFMELFSYTWVRHNCSRHIFNGLYMFNVDKKTVSTESSNKDKKNQPKGCDQWSTKNVTNGTLRFHSVAKQDKVPNRSVRNLKTDCSRIESNKIWFGKAKSEKQRKEANKAEEGLKEWCHGKVQKTFH